MTFDKKKILITGAKGFVGASMMKKFYNEGFEVEGWDILDNQDKILNVKNVDLSNVESVKYNLKSFAPNIIIHCAGSADVGKSILNPEMDYNGNVTLTHNLLFSLSFLNMYSTRFVFLSSAAVYGNPTKLPISEDMLLNPLSPYALHKAMCEDICMFFAKNHKINVKIARIFSAYGIGLKKQIFWDMHNKLLLTGKLDMYGTGNESRDYINIVDLTQALYLIATTSANDFIYNVGNGEEITIQNSTKFFAKIAKLKNDKIKFNGNVREGEPLNWQADIKRLKSIGYFKTVSMEKGLEDYYEWVMNL